MSRSNWLFPIPVSEIAAGVAERIDYHRQRLGWWKNELAFANQRLRESGIEIRESQYTGGERLEAIVDPSMGRRINECTNKIRGHENDIEAYEAFAVGLTYRQPGELLELTADDIRWAGLVATDETDGES